EIGTSHSTSYSSRTKSGCSFTCTTTYKSPEGPPCSPISPSPASRTRVPVSTPGGIFTCRLVSLSSLPLPRQFLQGSLTIVPLPPHWLQARETAKKPWVKRTSPAPPQVGHWRVCLLFEPVPAHSSQRLGRGIFTVTSAPK